MFITALNCIDGRLQRVVLDFIKDIYNIEFVDMITAPGIDGFFLKDKVLRDYIKESIFISLEKHNSKNILVFGHEDCAGNPVKNQEHIENIKRVVDYIKENWLKDEEEIEVKGFFLRKENDYKWIVEEVI